MSQGHWSGSCCSESQRVVPASLIQRPGPVCVEQFAPKWKDYWMSLDDIEQLLANYWLLLDAFVCYSRWLSGIGCYWMLLHIIGCLCSVLPEPPHLYMSVAGFQLPRFTYAFMSGADQCVPSWRWMAQLESVWQKKKLLTRCDSWACDVVDLSTAKRQGLWDKIKLPVYAGLWYFFNVPGLSLQSAACSNGFCFVPAVLRDLLRFSTISKIRSWKPTCLWHCCATPLGAWKLNDSRLILESLLAKLPSNSKDFLRAEPIFWRCLNTVGSWPCSTRIGRCLGSSQQLSAPHELRTSNRVFLRWSGANLELNMDWTHHLNIWYADMHLKYPKINE